MPNLYRRTDARALLRPSHRHATLPFSGRPASIRASLRCIAVLLVLAAAAAGCSARAAYPASAPLTSPVVADAAVWHPVPLPLTVTPPLPSPAGKTAAGVEPSPGATRVYADGMTGVYVPAGEFTMGLADDQPVSWPDERPRHQAYLDGYWIDRTEVTNAMYARCVQAAGCPPPDKIRSFTHDHYFDDPNYADYPVIFVSWHAARQYCTWAGRGLPTEAQWEKAARGVDARLHPWGNEPPDPSRGNAGNELGDTTAVGSYPAGASPYGALDMAGNVWEWVADLYGADYYKNAPLDNPQGPNWGNSRLVRGGSWSVTQRTTTTSERQGYGYRATEDRIGIRCAAP